MFCLCFSQFSIAIMKCPRRYRDGRFVLAHDFSIHSVKNVCQKQTSSCYVCVRGCTQDDKGQDMARTLTNKGTGSLHTSPKPHFQRSSDPPQRCYSLKVPHTFPGTILGHTPLKWACKYSKHVNCRGLSTGAGHLFLSVKQKRPRK